MLEYKRLTKQRRKFLALTGLTPKEFKRLLPAFCEVYESGRAGDTTQRGQVRQRPKSLAKQALYYSGTQKTHSDKNVVVVNAKTKRVGYLSQTYPGKTPDKKIVDHEALGYPRDTILYQDTGFQGYAPQARRPGSRKKAPPRSLVQA
jgi:DDE superfamily endonuclease